MVPFHLPVPPSFLGSPTVPQTFVFALHIVLAGLLVDTSH